MPVIDVWAVLADPDIPSDVGQRLLARQRARRLDEPVPACPEEDQPYRGCAWCQDGCPSVDEEKCCQAGAPQ